MVMLVGLTPYPTEGETRQKLVPGGTGVWNFKTTSDVGAPAQLAELMLVVTTPEPRTEDNWPNPERDYKEPKVFLDNKPFDHRNEQFMFPPDASFDIRVEITLCKTAQPKGRPFLTQMYVWPYYRALAPVVEDKPTDVPA